MKNIEYTCVTQENELRQIIHLQQTNLPSSISETEKQKEGFVTVQHDLNILNKMNNKQPHIIAKDEDKVVGYALCMPKEFKEDIEILKPMFSKIDQHLTSGNSYIAMGQICIDKAYRRQGIFRGLYQKMKSELQTKYDYLITEVASNNLRSIQAHQAIGFNSWITYAVDGIEWHLIRWNWE